MYFVFISEVRGRYYALKFLRATEAEARARADVIYEKSAKITLVGSSADADVANDMYDKACIKAGRLEKKNMIPENLF